ncbi:hypothetical protein IAG44_12375 [Streptomyces roseirectus]|uniref:Uncharacterized protein n=1 Tax=Streptomyces roseirectus TaxID=2768066 RepID=A0A7H0IBK1_9ACTN|nr:hypothetical protein [Streptomyces roseirectus]QNP70167.1 hypothetical protein IAG44_12375 [Streptomyces roseirectus]
MVVGLIIACEVAFWVLLAAGLTFRYALKMPRTGLAFLLCEPLLEVVLFLVTAMDLRDGAEPSWHHGVAAVYIGFTVGLGHSTIKWADAKVSHRYFGGPPPVKPPKYGRARALHEWKVAARWITAASVAAGLLQAAIWYVGDTGDTGSLRGWQSRMFFVIGINVIIAAAYTVFPKRAPEGVEERAKEKAQW